MRGLNAVLMTGKAQLGLNVAGSPPCCQPSGGGSLCGHERGQTHTAMQITTPKRSSLKPHLQQFQIPVAVGTEAPSRLMIWLGEERTQEAATARAALPDLMALFWLWG